MDLYRRLFWPVLAPSILFGIAGGATVPVQVLAALRLGATPSFAAALVAVTAAIGLVTTVPVGRLIDRVGDGVAMLLATALAALTEIGSIVALVWAGPGALWLFVATSLVRAPALIVWGLARQAFTAEHVGQHEVGRAMTALGGTMRIGALVGPLLGGLLLLALPLWSVYALSVGCAVAALGTLSSSGLGGSAGAREPRRGRDADEPPGAPLAVDWGRVALAGVAISTLALARTCQPVVLQLWGVHAGLTEATISLVVAVGAGVEVVLMFPGGYLKDRLGRAAILVTCLVVYGTGFLLLVPLTGWLGVPGMVTAVVVMALGNGLGAGVNMTIGADLSPSRGRGRFLGIWALFSNVGGLAGPALVSALLTLVSLPAAVAAVGGIAVAGAAWMVATAPRVALPKGVDRRPVRPGA